MIENFEPSNLRTLRAELETALAEVAARNGIKLSLGKMTYDPSSASFRAPLEGKAASNEDRERKTAIDLARSYCGVDASEPSTFPARRGAVLVEYRIRSRSKPWVFSWGGKNYITDNAGMKMIFPKAVIEDPGFTPREVAPPRFG